MGSSSSVFARTEARGWDGLDLQGETSLEQAIVVVEALHPGEGRRDLLI
jgi:hypothetical protein